MCDFFFKYGIISLKIEIKSRNMNFSVAADISLMHIFFYCAIGYYLLKIAKIRNFFRIICRNINFLCRWYFFITQLFCINSLLPHQKLGKMDFCKNAENFHAWDRIVCIHVFSQSEKNKKIFYCCGQKLSENFKQFFKLFSLINKNCPQYIFCVCYNVLNGFEWPGEC